MAWLKTLLVVLAAVLFVVIVARFFSDESDSRNQSKEVSELGHLPSIKISEEVVASYKVAYVVGESNITSLDIAQELGLSYQKVIAFLNTHQLEMDGMPLAIKSSLSIAEQRYVFKAAIPVAAETSLHLSNDEVKIAETYAGKALKAVHVGPYDRLSIAYDMMEKYIQEHHLDINGDSWEHYVNDPGLVDEDQIITHVYIPVKPRK